MSWRSLWSRWSELVPIAALISAGFLLLLGIATIVYGTRIYTNQITRDATIQARILASTVSAVLAFDDARSGQEYVNALKSNATVQAAAIYTVDGRKFVWFSRSGSDSLPAVAPPQQTRIDEDRLTVVVPVTLSGKKLGSVYLQTVIQPVGERLLRYGLMAILVIMTALIVAGLGFSQAALARANLELQRRASELGKSNEDLVFQINQRQRVEAELRQSQKMEAIGQLTGGIAHDFNNLLQIILGSLEMVRRRSAGWQLEVNAARDFNRLVDSAVEGGKRASALTQQLLAFSRRQPLAPKAVDVNKLVAGISGLIGRTLGEPISIETILAAGAWAILVDPNQLESAVLNLAVNARDAMKDGGKLTIETANAYLDEQYIRTQDDLAPGQYVVISVTDTGVGMSKETAVQAFEPFFTTKEAGKGTGLGLSQVYGFTKQSGGNVKIYSEPGHGTTVKLYLPRYISDEDELADSPFHQSISSSANGETILVVEDEEGVRSASVEMLQELGYAVLEATDGPTALRILERSPEVTLLFTDVVLPNGLNGRQLADAARSLRPELKVLYTTGYARNAIVHHGRLDPGVDLISKPFSYAALAAKVSEILQA
ncbi:MAG: ATP-binding protein [Rhizomicrobium sp.]|jgi:signal transduction histidine kinase